MSPKIHKITLFVIKLFWFMNYNLSLLVIVRITYLVTLLICNTSSNNQNKARYMLLNRINKQN